MIKHVKSVLLLTLTGYFLCNGLLAEDGWPLLPAENGAVMIPAQEWPQQPGPRGVRILVHYPQGKLENVNERTGAMLSLHNWGGEDCVGTASPQMLADKLNVVAICVNYLQSGRKASIDDPEPYDCGYLQALDALRALWFVCDGLRKVERPYDSGRLFATGGSGGGNVTLMVNKMAPRTFACIVDLCGMKKLSHDIAFHLPGGSDLDARWSRDPQSPNYLSVDEQEIRFVGHPVHLSAMKQNGAACKIVVVHGVDDTTCPYTDAVELVENLKQAELDVEPHFITNADIDNRVFASTGHALGNRTEIVLRVAEKYLRPYGADALRRSGPSDFDLRDEQVRYRTSNGTFVISYKSGYPVGRFELASKPVAYTEHQELTNYLDSNGNKQPVRSADDWDVRRGHILENMQLVMGKLPPATMRVALDVKVEEERKFGEIVGRKISYQSDPFDRVTAWLLLPERREQEKLPAVLCLHQTTERGKDETVGLAGADSMHYGLELAKRGYIVLAPDYPSFGDHQYDFAANPEYASGTMKAIWDNIRAVDLLQSLPEVDGARIGVIGHSLGGHNAMFTAAFEPRLKAIVSSCGFTRFHKDDVPSWTGPPYMPRIESEYGNDADRLPFDFTEIVAAFAPRPFLACAATGDSDFDVSGVRDVIDSAKLIYELLGKPDNLQAFYPDSPHAFPEAARERAYKFLDQHLRGEGN